MNDSRVNMNVFYADYIPALNATVRIGIMNDADVAFNDFMRLYHGRDTWEQLTDANILVASGCYPLFPCYWFPPHV